MKTKGIALGAVLLSAIVAARAAGQEPAFSVGKSMAASPTAKRPVGGDGALHRRIRNPVGGADQARVSSDPPSGGSPSSSAPP